MNVINKDNYPDKKFIDVVTINDWEIETNDGWVDILAIGKTIPYKIWKLILQNGDYLEAADNHIIITYNQEKQYEEKFLSELSYNDLVVTRNGNIAIKSIEITDIKENMYDLEINSNTHLYYTNNILSHNSFWMCNLAAKSVLRGHNTAYVTLELQEEMVIARIGSNILNIPMDDYENIASSDIDLIKSKLGELKQNSLTPLGNLHIKEFPSSSASANDIAAYLKKVEDLNNFKFDNVFIDYVNIMKNWRNPNSENTYMKIKQISEDLRAMGMINLWTVITCTQTNRCLSPNSIIEHKEKGKIKLSDINIGDYILSDNGYIKVKEKFINKDTKTYKIKTKSGKEIICSGTHIFPTNKGTFKNVNNLNVGDILYVKNPLCSSDI